MSKYDDKYRVRWWVQNTEESGYWAVSGLMSLNEAELYYKSNMYDQLEIVLDEEGFPVYKGYQWRLPSD